MKKNHEKWGKNHEKIFKNHKKMKKNCEKWKTIVENENNCEKWKKLWKTDLGNVLSEIGFPGNVFRDLSILVKSIFRKCPFREIHSGYDCKLPWIWI